eukprot:6441141-Pyramimonas_sp.AAC.1
MSLKRSCPDVARVPSRQMRYGRRVTTRPLKTITHCQFLKCAAAVPLRDGISSRGQISWIGRPLPEG